MSNLPADHQLIQCPQCGTAVRLSADGRMPRHGFGLGTEDCVGSRTIPHIHKWDIDGERCEVCGDKDWMTA